MNFGAISGLTSPSIGSAVISAAQGSDLLNGLWYINIHSDRPDGVSAGGEIRGQVLVIPEPGVLGAIFLGTTTLAAFYRRRRRDSR